MSPGGAITDDEIERIDAYWRAVDRLRREVPDLPMRVVNVIDLMALQPPSEHPHGLSDADFDALFTVVRGYKEEGTTITPFDMVLERVPRLVNRTADVHQRLRDRLVEHARYIVENGDDLPDIRDWRWDAQPEPAAG